MISADSIQKLIYQSEGMNGSQIKSCVNQAVVNKIMGDPKTLKELWSNFDQLIDAANRSQL